MIAGGSYGRRVSGYDWRPSTSAASTTTAPQAVVSPRRETTVASLVDEFVGAAEEGRAVNRSGRPYRPSALRDLSGILRHHVVPDLGQLPLRDVSRRHIQGLVDRLAREGLSESRIRSVVSALRALYGYAIGKGHVEASPADTLEMPAVDTRSSETWDDPPKLEDPPKLQDPPRWDDRPAPRTRDRWRPADEPRRPREPREAPSAPPRERTDYQPMGVLPERILSLALKVALVAFVLIALVSLLQPA
jgi:hypothetical protein